MPDPAIIDEGDGEVRVMLGDDTLLVLRYQSDVRRAMAFIMANSFADGFRAYARREKADG